MRGSGLGPAGSEQTRETENAENSTGHVIGLHRTVGGQWASGLRAARGFGRE